MGYMYKCIIALAAICIQAVRCGTVINYRLNTTLKPSSYDISVTPYFETNDDLQFTFDGKVVIVFTTTSPTKQIKVHSQNLTYEADNITVSSGKTKIKLDTSEPLIFDHFYDFAYINLGTDLKINTAYTLTIEYRGPIRSDLKGFYRNYYIENGVKKWLGATQMEPTHARKVFPCFDEPALKATFKLTIYRPEDYQPSLTNTKLQSNTTLGNGRVQEEFYPTPIMSTYLVAFVISEFVAKDKVEIGTEEFGVYARPEATNQTKFAFDLGQKIEIALSDYFGIDYYSTDPNIKLDHVALVNFNAGAMENWGLITYREALLLYVEGVSNPNYKYKTAQTLAHETTHMWFGNLVTCHWWSNTWLNEGFANYFQDYITDLVEPEIGSAGMHVTSSVYDALDADESADSVPISYENVNSPTEISEHFGTITYQKAGSVIMMMHHLIGNDAFKTGLHSYLENNKFQPGYPDKLYEGLQQGVTAHDGLSLYPGADIADIMGSWISRAGHPVVYVEVDHDTNVVSLTQNRFYTNSSVKSDEVYKIPITYTTGLNPDFNDTKPEFIMTNVSHEFVVPDLGTNNSWILLNIQETGLYRVNYDGHMWSHIASALNSEEREIIHPLNRAKLINDLFAFFIGDLVEFNQIYTFLDFLKTETDYSVWYATIKGFKKMRSYYFGCDILPKIEAYQRDVLDSIVQKLGFQDSLEDSFITKRNRLQVMEYACRVGHQACNDNAVSQFKNLRDNGVEVDPSMRPAVYCTGLHLGTADDYNFLWTRMSTTNIANEARVIGEALSCTSHEESLKKYLVSMLVENSPILTQDLNVPLTNALSNYNNLQLILEELDTNYSTWVNIYSTMNNVFYHIAVALRTEEDFNQFENWLSSCTQCSEESVGYARVKMEETRRAAAWAQDHKEDIMSRLGNSANTGTFAISNLIVAIVAGVFGTRM